MKNLPLPVSFEDPGQMNIWYELFENRIIEICREYDELSLIDSIKIYKGGTTNKIEIISVGSYIKGSRREEAIRYILGTFEAMWGG